MRRLPLKSLVVSVLVILGSNQAASCILGTAIDVVRADLKAPKVILMPNTSSTGFHISQECSRVGDVAKRCQHRGRAGAVAVMEDSTGRLVGYAGCCVDVFPKISAIRPGVCIKRECDNNGICSLKEEASNSDESSSDLPHSTQQMTMPPTPPLPPRMNRLWRRRWTANDAAPSGICYALEKGRPHATPGGTSNPASYSAGTKQYPRCRGGTEWSETLLTETVVRGQVQPTSASADQECRAAGKQCTGRLEWEPTLRMADFPRGCSFASCFDTKKAGCQTYLAEGGTGPIPTFVYRRHEPEKLRRESETIDMWKHLGPAWDNIWKSGIAAARGNGGIIDVVPNANDACLFIAVDMPVRGNPAHWGESGANHFLFNPNADGRHHVDRAGMETPMGDAMVSISANTPFTYRQGYDIQLPCVTKWHFDDNNNVDSKYFVADPRPASNRSMLLFFRGTVHVGYWSKARAVYTRWMADRWAGIQIHDPSRGIIMDTYCGERTHKYRTDIDYIEGLRDTKYAWTPGGGGGYSYRFWEAMAAGAIPVVTSDLVLPLDDPEPVGPLQTKLHRLWRQCVVVVEPEMIPQMGDFLEAAEASGQDCATHRQRACIELFRTCFDTATKIFTCPVTIVADRIRAALRADKI